MWDVDKAFDDMQMELLSPAEIKHKNKTRTNCCNCGADTKELYNFRYCPIGCGEELKLDKIEYDQYETAEYDIFS